MRKHAGLATAALAALIGVSVAGRASADDEDDRPSFMPGPLPSGPRTPGEYRGRYLLRGDYGGALRMKFEQQRDIEKDPCLKGLQWEVDIAPPEVIIDPVEKHGPMPGTYTPPKSRYTEWEDAQLQQTADGLADLITFGLPALRIARGLRGAGVAARTAGPQRTARRFVPGGEILENRSLLAGGGPLGSLERAGEGRALLGPAEVSTSRAGSGSVRALPAPGAPGMTYFDMPREWSSADGRTFANLAARSGYIITYRDGRLQVGVPNSATVVSTVPSTVDSISLHTSLDARVARYGGPYAYIVLGGNNWAQLYDNSTFQEGGSIILRSTLGQVIQATGANNFEFDPELIPKSGMNTGEIFYPPPFYQPDGSETQFGWMFSNQDPRLTDAEKGGFSAFRPSAVLSRGELISNTQY